RLNRLALLEKHGLGDQVSALEVVRESQHFEIFRGIELAPGFEHNHAQAFFGQFLGGPPAGRARTDDYRVVNYLLRHHLSCFAFDLGFGVREIARKLYYSQGQKGNGEWGVGSGEWNFTHS